LSFYSLIARSQRPFIIGATRFNLPARPSSTRVLVSTLLSPVYRNDTHLYVISSEFATYRRDRHLRSDIAASSATPASPRLRAEDIEDVDAREERISRRPEFGVSDWTEAGRDGRSTVLSLALTFPG